MSSTHFASLFPIFGFRRRKRSRSRRRSKSRSKKQEQAVDGHGTDGASQELDLELKRQLLAASHEL